jgi:hypothetical protein
MISHDTLAGSVQGLFMKNTLLQLYLVEPLLEFAICCLDGSILCAGPTDPVTGHHK